MASRSATTATGALFLLATVLIVYQAYLGLSFGLIAKDMSADLGIALSESGVISAVFLTAVALLQIPAGMLLDRFRATKVLAIATIVCAAGSMMLAVAEGPALAIVSRLLTGGGAAFAMVGALKLLALAVSRRRYVFTVGTWHVVHSLGVTGVALLTAASQLEHDWRVLMGIVAAIGVVIAAMLWFAPRSPVPEVEAPSAEPVAIRAALANRQVLLAALFFGLSFGPFISYVELWAVPHERAWGHSRAISTDIAGMLPLGIGSGAFILGLLVDWTRRPRLLGAVILLAGIGFTLYLLFGPHMPIWEVYLLTYLFGFTGSVSILAAGHVRNVAPQASGTALGIVTGAGYLVAALLQVVIGLLLGVLEKPKGEATLEFGYGLAPLAACFVLAFVILFMMRLRSNGTR